MFVEASIIVGAFLPSSGGDVRGHCTIETASTRNAKVRTGDAGSVVEGGGGGGGGGTGRAEADERREERTKF